MEINLGADTSGLYTLETVTGEGESSDFEEKPGKIKEGKLGVKKKDKEDKDKDKKKDKDKGYAALEGESSPEESEMEVKSPFKGKKRSFKFSSRKEKKSKDEEKEKKKEKDRKLSKESDISPKELREETSKVEKTDKKKDKKEKEKETKVKEKETKVKDKEKDVKSKDIKNKLKIKDKMKKTKPHTSLEDDLPVFGVPLELAIQRSGSHDGIDLPVVVRCCIDYIEDYGLQQEGIFRSSGLKTRVVELRRAYNNRENVVLKDVDPPIVASLLKQYLRELPDNILSNELLSKFEDASSIKDSQLQEETFSSLIRQLPVYNRTLLSWLMVLMDHVIEKERFNKMNVQNLSIVLCPTLNLTHRVLGCLFAYSRSLFAGTQIIRYIPPLSGVGVSLPDEFDAMTIELKKQESLLAQIHCEMSVGSVAKHREEQLWEAQRIVTQLKRQLKLQAPTSTAPMAAVVQNTVSETPKPATLPDVGPSGHDVELRLELALPVKVLSEPADQVPNPELRSDRDIMEQDEEVSKGESPSAEVVDESIQEPPPKNSTENACHVTVIEITGHSAESASSDQNTGWNAPETETPLTKEEEMELLLMIENHEREKIIEKLSEAIEKERKSIERLQELLADTTTSWTDSSEDDDGLDVGEEEQEQLLAEVLRENRQLEEQNMLLQSQIEEIGEACLKFRAQLRLREEKTKLPIVGANGIIA
ncbi:ralA-binding protein 1-like isoform X2 [Daphnia carinata]|uniref:ralA-binding protein 1-like isoform X2 n=1 Tax=Daphnia carinata TaxID=120202 RepID=UPI00286900FA|nr:ralA-binding protein 1-like isoform X2 [Daphnia carinata]